jgi:hypothetical protein
MQEANMTRRAIALASLLTDDQGNNKKGPYLTDAGEHADMGLGEPLWRRGRVVYRSGL